MPNLVLIGQGVSAGWPTKNDLSHRKLISPIQHGEALSRCNVINRCLLHHRPQCWRKLSHGRLLDKIQTHDLSIVRSRLHNFGRVTNTFLSSERMQISSELQAVALTLSRCIIIELQYCNFCISYVSLKHQRSVRRQRWFSRNGFPVKKSTVEELRCRHVLKESISWNLRF